MDVGVLWHSPFVVAVTYTVALSTTRVHGTPRCRTASPTSVDSGTGRGVTKPSMYMYRVFTLWNELLYNIELSKRVKCMFFSLKKSQTKAFNFFYL